MSCSAIARGTEGEGNSLLLLAKEALRITHKVGSFSFSFPGFLLASAVTALCPRRTKPSQLLTCSTQAQPRGQGSPPRVRIPGQRAPGRGQHGLMCDRQCRLCSREFCPGTSLSFLCLFWVGEVAESEKYPHEREFVPALRPFLCSAHSRWEKQPWSFSGTHCHSSC